jgi:mono/diheme cytochrome c family protein
MKKAFLLIALFILLLFACNREKKQSFLSTDNIRTQIFRIDPTKENRINGARGGIFTIPAGAFEGSEAVAIELKEVYAPIEILAAGLTTESNGELLESGGMFYINAKRDGKELELKKEINGSIPTHYINDSMKFFKGEVEENGNVNWVDPVPLSNEPDPNMICIEAGRQLFQTNCTSCHDIFKKLTGPALANTDKKYTRQDYYKLIRNPAAFGKENNYFACEIKAYNGILMTGFPVLHDQEIDCIIEYINNEAQKRPDLIIEADSSFWGSEGCNVKDVTTNFPCGLRTIYIDTVPKTIDSNLPPMHAEAGKDKTADSLYKPTQELEERMRRGFSDYTPTTENDRYAFNIKTLGWFNIDAYYQPLTGTTIVDLFVDTDFDEEEKLEIHVFLPAKKLLTVGVHHADDGLFHFEKYKGQIPMYLSDKAVVFAVTSIGEKLYYGISSFTVKQTQTIKLTIKETNEETLDKAFRKMNLDGIDLDVITKKEIVVEIPCNDSIPLMK